MSGDRPVSEDQLDREQEEQLARFLQQLHRWPSIERTPKMYPCDWVVDLGGGDFGLLELKWRKARFERYMISLHKAAQLITFADIGRFVPMLGVGWRNTREVALWEDLRKEWLEPGFGGRRDRGDHQDVEPVVYVPVRYARVQQYF